MKQTYYFQHDNNSYTDEKIIKLRMEYGLEGYAIYWIILEQLHQNEGIMELDSNCLAFAMQLDSKVVDGVINDFDLFGFDGKKFYSNRMLKHFENRSKMSQKRSEAGKIGAKKRWKDEGKMASAKQVHGKCMANDSKGKERKGKEKKGNKKREEKILPKQKVVFEDNKKQEKFNEQHAEEIVTMDYINALFKEKKYRLKHDNNKKYDIIEDVRESWITHHIQKQTKVVSYKRSFQTWARNGVTKDWGGLKIHLTSAERLSMMGVKSVEEIAEERGLL